MSTAYFFTTVLKQLGSAAINKIPQVKILNNLISRSSRQPYTIIDLINLKNTSGFSDWIFEYYIFPGKLPVNSREGLQFVLGVVAFLGVQENLKMIQHRDKLFEE